MKEILILGYNASDVVVSVAELPPPDSKREVDDIIYCGGGPAATAAVAMARLGARVRLVTPLAVDLAGQIQQAELVAAGVDISYSPIRAGYRSPRAVILVDEPRQERRILWTRGDLPHLAANDVDPNWLRGVELLYLDCHEPKAAVTLARLARQRGLRVVLDAGNVREGVSELVPHCSDVISSQVFAPRLTGLSDPAAALLNLTTLGPERVAMTFGKAGCLALEDGRVVHVPAFAVQVRDTTGAGDAFHAGYAFALASGKSWLDCLTFGSATAALKCRDWGGRRGLPTLSEVEQLLATGQLRKDRPGFGFS
jgi:sugar/nucleoside kinase (ribokinase family)